MDNCGCGSMPEQMVIAMAYVPKQQWNGTYDLCEGLKKGTIFPELDKPFMVGGGRIDG